MVTGATATVAAAVGAVAAAAAVRGAAVVWHFLPGHGDIFRSIDK